MNTAIRNIAVLSNDELPLHIKGIVRNSPGITVQEVLASYPQNPSAVRVAVQRMKANGTIVIHYGRCYAIDLSARSKAKRSRYMKHRVLNSIEN